MRAGIADPHVEWSSPAGAAGQGHVGAAGVAAPSARSWRSTTRSSRWTPAAARPAVRARRQRGAAPAQRATPGWPPSWTDPLVSESTSAPTTTGRAGGPGAPDAAPASLRIGGRHVPRDHRPGDDGAPGRVLRRPGPGAPSRPRLSPGRSSSWSSSSATAGRATRSEPALVDQVAAALAAAHCTGWDGLVDAQRAYLDEFWAGADVEVDGDAAPAAGGPVRPLPRAAGGCAGREAADRGEGPDRAGLRRAHASGTPRRSCCRCSCTRSPVGRGRRAALAAPDARRWRRRHAERPRPEGGGVRLADDPRRGVLRVLAGRDGRVPHQRRHRRRRASATWTATEDTDFEREVGLELLVETARLWRSLGHHDSESATSGSTA